MMKPFVAAIATLVTIQPAIAATTLADFNVYTDQKTAIAGGGSYGDIASNGFSNAGGKYDTQTTLPVADRAALTTQANALSQYYLALPETAYNFTGGKFARVLHGTSGVNVVTLDAAELNSFALRLTFQAPTATGLILNISGAKGSLVDFNFGALDPTQVLFNFYEATEVSGASKDIPGSILAPLAKVAISGSHVAGSIVSNSFSSAKTKIDGKAFIGFGAPPLAPGVPEPATWAMMILGFGVVGTALRYHQKFVVRTA